VSVSVPAWLTAAADVTVTTIAWMPKNSEHMLVVTRTSNIYVMTQRGELVRTYSSGKTQGSARLFKVASTGYGMNIQVCLGGTFITATVSPRGEFVYGVAEDYTLYCFRADTAELLSTLKVHSKR
jgi:WD40 repeat-containing protein SMU1